MNSINHYTIQRVIDVAANVEGRDLGSTAAEIKAAIAQVQKELPSTTKIFLRGQNEVMENSFRMLGLGLILAVILVYAVLVVLFQSWLDPFIIMMAVPGALLGIIWMLAVSGTTINVGVVGGGTRPNVVAAHARAEIDVRFARATEAERVVRAINDLQPKLAGARLHVSGGVDRPPMERSAGTIRLAQLAQRLAGEVGFALSETSTGGGSDGNFTAAIGVATLDGLGPDGGGAHADSEHLLIQSWLDRTELLRRLIEAL